MSRYGEPRIERAEVCAYVEDGDLVYPPHVEGRTPAAPASGAEQASPRVE